MASADWRSSSAGSGWAQSNAGTNSSQNLIRTCYASVRLACARKVKSANSARASLGKAAAAIMAALSVERPGAGKKTGYGTLLDWAAARKPELQATPPETIKLR